MSHIAQASRRLIFRDSLKTLNLSEVSGAKFSAVPVLTYDFILAIGKERSTYFDPWHISDLEPLAR